MRHTDVVHRLLELLAAAILAAVNSPEPAVRAPNCDMRPARPAPGTVLVYLRKEQASYTYAASPRTYVARARRVTPTQARAPLRAALEALFRGPSARERRLGCASIFEGKRSLGLLRDVSIVRGQAIVNFNRRLESRFGIASTTTGGAIFGTQLELTMFQFPTVESIRYELNGSCKRFYDLMQVGECSIVHRSQAF